MSKIIKDAMDIGKDIIKKRVVEEALADIAELRYNLPQQERNSIEVIVDGTPILITADNCESTVLELFRDVVLNRQIKRICLYLKKKYPYNSCLPKKQALKELIGLELPYDAEFFEFEEIATIIATDFVHYEK